jgi:hypothetical protein
MEQLRIFWGINFIFFALTLIFVWSKILIISRKINRIRDISRETSVLVKEKDTLKKESQAAAAPTEDERPK